MRCILIGNYGVGNLGDEALRDYFLASFPDIEWVVLSAHPRQSHERARLPLGFRSLFQAWPRTLREFRRCDAVVFGGGTLWTDSESLYACFLWSWHALIAWVFRKPYHLAFQGVGPFRTTIGEHITRWICRHATTISVRDHASRARMETWILNKNIVLSFDPVFSLFLKEKQDKSSKNVFILIPRSNIRHFINIAVVDVDSRTFRGPVRIVTFTPDNQREHRMLEDFAEHLRGEDNEVSIEGVRTVVDITSAFKNAGFVLSARYHGCIAAEACGIPWKAVTQMPGDKLDELSEEVRQGEKELLERIDAGVSALRSSLFSS